jgi:hypothetical protein
MKLMRDKYSLHIINKEKKNLLHIINEMKNIVGILRDFSYIYRCRKIITSYMNNSCK